MCFQIVYKRSKAPSSGRFRRVAGGAVGLINEPQTATGVVSFLQIRPAYNHFLTVFKPNFLKYKTVEIMKKFLKVHKECCPSFGQNNK